MSSVRNVMIDHKALIVACLSQYRMVREQLGGDSNVQIAIMGDDPTKFIFKIEGITGDESDPDSKEFEGGQYIGMIWQDSLQKPPSFKIYTPNGVIETGTANVCTVISKYHPQNYRPELKIYGFITNMMGAIKCWRYTRWGIGLLYNGDEKKQSAQIVRCAKLSKAWNLKHYPDELKAFDVEDLMCSVSKKLAEVTLNEKKIEEDREKMLDTMKTKKTTGRVRPTRRKKTGVKEVNKESKEKTPDVQTDEKDR